DYYHLLTKAVAGKDAAARDQIYKDAYGLILKSPLSREAVETHSAALEDAVRQIEDDIAAAEATPAAEINDVLSTRKSRMPLMVGLSALIGVVTVGGLLYRYLPTKGVGVAAVKAPFSKAASKAKRALEEPVMADLKPGEDGGSSGAGLP